MEIKEMNNKYQIYDYTDFEDEELKELEREFQDNYEDVQLIRDDEFEDYATDQAIELYIIAKRYLRYFDCESWANDMRSDHTSVTIGNIDYLVINE